MMDAMLDVAEVRRRLVHTIEGVRHDAALRRAAADRAAADYGPFLENVATPVFRHFAMALRAEGHLFRLFTPAGSVRLSSERSTDDFVELVLDSTRQPPEVIGRVSHGRGSRLITDEGPIREGAAVADLTEEDVLRFLLASIAPFVER
jgi:hypothetical protein